MRRRLQAISSRSVDSFSYKLNLCCVGFVLPWRIPPNSRPEWCRTNGFRMQPGARSRHPLQVDRSASRSLTLCLSERLVRELTGLSDPADPRLARLGVSHNHHAMVVYGRIVTTGPR